MNRGLRHIGPRIRWGVGALVSAVTLAVYVLTLAPTVTFIDSGELTAVCATLGIAHPTGYPLYTLVGRLFTSLPFGPNPAFRLNLMSALFASLTVFVMYNLLVSLQPARKGKTAGFTLLTSAAGALLLGFSRAFWSVALVAEVYALHALFVAATVLCLLKATEADRSPQRRRAPRLYALFAFLFGLGMANHMTTVVLLPACLYLLISKGEVKGLLARGVTVLAPAFLLGLSSYLYLPVRSAVQPLLDWGNPETIWNLLRHVSGRQYQVWMFSSVEVATRQLGVFFTTLPDQFSPFLLPAALLGLWRLYRRDRRVLLFTTLVFGVDLFYSINYDIHDIEAYFLPCFMVVAVWIGLGLMHVCEFLTSARTSLRSAVGGFILLLPVLPLSLHFGDVDRSEEYFVSDYCHNLLRGVGERGIIISRQWDFFCSPFYYLQHVEGVRPDVVLIEQELLRRSWYYPQLQRQYPWLIRASEVEVSDFLTELERFEKGQRYDQAVIQKKYIEMIDSFVTKSIDSRPVYITPEVEASIGSQYVKVPEGLAYRLYRDDRFRPFPKPSLQYRSLHTRSDDYFHRTVIAFYSQMWASRGMYLSRHGRSEEAREALRQALSIDPGNDKAKKELARLESLRDSEGQADTP